MRSSTVARSCLIARQRRDVQAFSRSLKTQVVYRPFVSSCVSLPPTNHNLQLSSTAPSHSSLRQYSRLLQHSRNVQHQKRSFFSWLFSTSRGGLSPKLADALNDPHAVLIDVRSREEIEESGTVRGPYPTQKWIHAPMSSSGSPILAEDAALFIPSKDATPVIIFCRSGNRAKAAQHILEAQGYEWVMNGINMENVEKHMPEEDTSEEESKA